MDTMTELVLAKEANAPKILPPLIFERIIIHLDDDDSVCSSTVSECNSESLEVPQTSLRVDSMHPEKALHANPSPLSLILDQYRHALTGQGPSPGLWEACEQAIITYLYYNPATNADVELLVPEFALKPVLMGKLTSNIGYFHSKGRISEAEVEKIYVALIVQADPLANYIFEQVRSAVAHFKSQAEENRTTWRRYKQQCQEYAAWCNFNLQLQQALVMENSATENGMGANTARTDGNKAEKKNAKKKKKKKKSSYVPEPAVDLDTLNEWEQVEAQQKSEAQLFRHWKKKYTVRIPKNDERTVNTPVAVKPLVCLPSPDAGSDKPDLEPLPPESSALLLPVIDKITCLRIS